MIGDIARAPLAGVTVTDLSRVLTGPYCTMILADLGARVIKIEHPDGGDDSRAFGPIVNGVSAYFMSVNGGKESIALDLKSAADREIFEKSLRTADVLVENFRPGTMEKLGYDWAELQAKYPTLIYAATSGFGHTGPYSSRADMTGCPSYGRHHVPYRPSEFAPDPGRQAISSLRSSPRSESSPRFSIGRSTLLAARLTSRCWIAK